MQLWYILINFVYKLTNINIWANIYILYLMSFLSKVEFFSAVK